MKTDAQLKIDVTRELEWEPSIDAANVGVAVHDGIVTLSGHLASHAEKVVIERAVQRVAGVRAIAVELDVRLGPGSHRSDTDIAMAASAALKWHALVPDERVRLQVEKGWVTLGGEVDWDYQRRAAEKTVRDLMGVTGVSNLIAIQPRATPDNVKMRIQDALARHAERETQGIDIRVAGSTVTLSGQVDSWPERMAAQGAAWSAPGITQVVNLLKIGSV